MNNPIPNSKFPLFVLAAIVGLSAGFLGMQYLVQGASGGVITMNARLAGISTPTQSSDLATKDYTSTQQGAGGKLKSQLFTSSGTFTVPSSVTLAWVTAWGGGGGGGRLYATGYNSGGGGGGGGEIVYRYPVTVTPAQNITVTVGAGGPGSPGSYGCAGFTGQTTGNDGGNSSFGSYVVAEGGEGGCPIGLGSNQGGQGGDSSTSHWSYPAGCGPTGGCQSSPNGKIGLSAVMVIRGAGGGAGLASGYSSGAGGASSLFSGGAGPRGGGGGGGFLGPGGDGGGTTAASGQSAAANSGAGGGGISSDNFGFGSSGGAGGSGGVIVEWVE